MGTENRENKKNNRVKRRAVGIAVAVLLLIAILCVANMLHFVLKNEQESGISRSIAPYECTEYGYSREGNSYINTLGDANTQLPELNQYVSYISVCFAEPIEQPLNITVYYAEVGHGYSEKYTSSVNLSANSDKADLFIGREITTCRIDIGTQIDEKFVLESIVINDAQLIAKPVLLEFFKTLVLFLLAVCFTVGLLAVFVYKLRVEKVFAILAGGLGFLYLLAITPLSVPDELHHYHSSYWLSNMILLQWDNAEYGDSAYFDYSDFAGHYNVSSGYIRVLEDIRTGPETGTETLIPTPRSLKYFVEYLPQALGVALGRITNQNFVRTFLLGRLCNLLFYISCLYLAVRRIPKFKITLGLIGIMPMSLHQAASFSYDGFINGMSFFLIASILKAVYEEGKLGRRDYFCILISGVLLAPAKVIYSVILLLCFLIPMDRFEDKRKKQFGIALILAAAIGAIAVFQLSSLTGMAGGTGGLNWEGQHNYTLGFVFQHPIQTLQIFVNTISDSGETWFYGMVGRSLSGLTLHVPAWIINMFILVIFLSVFSRIDTKDNMFGVHRGCFLFIFAVVLLLAMASMFLGWTSDTRQIVQGVQGRYLIPVFPLLAFALNNKTILLRRSIDKELFTASMLLHGGVIITILSYTMQH